MRIKCSIIKIVLYKCAKEVLFLNKGSDKKNKNLKKFRKLFIKDSEKKFDIRKTDFEQEGEDIEIATPAQKIKKVASGWYKPVLWIGFTCFILFALATIIVDQVKIAQYKELNTEVQQQITRQQQEHDEYMRLLGSDDDEYAFIEKIAIDRLGYAYPSERRYYVISDE